MPFAFAGLGLLFLVVAIRGTQEEMFRLLKSEFVGPRSFIPWVASILVLGAIGFIKPIRPITDALIGLVILAIILQDKGGFFQKFVDQLSNPVAPPTPAPSAADIPRNVQVLPGSGQGQPLPAFPGGLQIVPGLSVPQA